jgi:energy-coupling factor transporter ATP-binding protein EcfA2
MAIELHGKDFQSWGNFDLKIDGLTVAIGPSNVGKSALFRSLKGLVRNTLNANQVRIGGDGMEISATIEGQTITATRTVGKRGAIGSISYQIGANTYDKLQKKLPDEVQALNMNEIEIGEIKLDPIFASQFGSQFMLEEKPTPLNQILGAFSSTEKLEGGKRNANQRIAVKNTEAKALAVDIRETAERAAKLTALADQATEIRVTVDALEPELRRQEQAVELLGLLITQKLRLHQLNDLISRFVIPDSEPVARLISITQAFEQARVALSTHQRVTNALSRLIMPNPEPVALLLNVAEAAGQVVTARVAHDRVTSILSRLEVPDATAVISNYKIAHFASQAVSSIERLNVANAGYAACEACVQAFNVVGVEYKRGLAITAAVAALEARANSRPEAFIKKLDARMAKLDKTIAGVNGSMNTLGQLDDLIHRLQRLGLLETALQARETEYSEASTSLEQLQAAEREHLHHVELAKQVKKVTICPKCGETIEAAA